MKIERSVKNVRNDPKLGLRFKKMTKIERSTKNVRNDSKLSLTYKILMKYREKCEKCAE